MVIFSGLDKYGMMDLITGLSLMNGSIGKRLIKKMAK